MPVGAFSCTATLMKSHTFNPCKFDRDDHDIAQEEDLSDHDEVNVDDVSEENNNKSECNETDLDKETEINTKPQLGIFSMESLIKPCRYKYNKLRIYFITMKIIFCAETNLKDANGNQENGVGSPT